MKRYLVVGSGGREHALAWKLAEGGANEVWVAPGNAGIASDPDIAGCLHLSVADLDGLVDAARERKIDLTIVGPEAPLCAGIVDRFRVEGLAAFGPTADAARLEESKAFAKDVMTAAGVKTSAYGVFSDFEAAAEYVRGSDHPLVIKADGLAGGKGVVIAEDVTVSLETLESFMRDARFGESSSRVVIEEFLEGPELSFMCITDGDTILPLATSRDHKRVWENDQGPNTGGMGAITPSPDTSAELEATLVEEVVRPVLAEMKRMGTPFTGFLYAGLMLTERGPYVLEFNVRMGDPETQPLLFALNGPLGPALEATVAGELASVELGEFSAACAVVLASRGYPGKAETGFVIHGLDHDFGEDVKVFHAGTKRDDGGEFINAGGRVLAVTARADAIEQARELAYAACEHISWEGMHYRRDIGA